MTVPNNSDRLVHCSKLGKDLPGLEKPPFSGEIGNLIYEKISKSAWLMWKDDMQIKVLNEYRLNMSDKNDYQKLVDQMLLFLNLKDSGQLAEVENSERGKANK